MRKPRPRINLNAVNKEGLNYEVIFKFNLNEKEIMLMNEIERINENKDYGYMIVTQNSLANKLGIDRTNLSTMLKCLNEMDFIKINKKTKGHITYRPSNMYKELYKNRLKKLGLEVCQPYEFVELP